VAEGVTTRCLRRGSVSMASRRRREAGRHGRSAAVVTRRVAIAAHRRDWRHRLSTSLCCHFDEREEIANRQRKARETLQSEEKKPF
jgi:hypothetical protein